MYTAFAVDPLKDIDRFRNVSIREPYERSLWSEHMSEPFIEKPKIYLSTELSNVNREKHKRDSHRAYRRDREPRSSKKTKFLANGKFE